MMMYIQSLYAAKHDNRSWCQKQTMRVLLQGIIYETGPQGVDQNGCLFIQPPDIW